MEETRASTAFAALLTAHPAHADAIRSSMWMSDEGGTDRFKHRHSRRGFTFDQATGRVTGELDTGEPSDDADAVLRHIGTI